MKNYWCFTLIVISNLLLFKYSQSQSQDEKTIPFTKNVSYLGLSGLTGLSINQEKIFQKEKLSFLIRVGVASGVDEFGFFTSDADVGYLWHGLLTGAYLRLSGKNLKHHFETGILINSGVYSGKIAEIDLLRFRVVGHISETNVSFAQNYSISVGYRKQNPNKSLFFKIALSPLYHYILYLKKENIFGNKNSQGIGFFLYGELGIGWSY